MWSTGSLNAEAVSGIAVLVRGLPIEVGDDVLVKGRR
jgi:hypothetical protein